MEGIFSECSVVSVSQEMKYEKSLKCGKICSKIWRKVFGAKIQKLRSAPFLIVRNSRPFLSQSQCRPVFLERTAIACILSSQHKSPAFVVGRLANKSECWKGVARFTLGNENSAQSFSDQSFWKPLEVVDVRAFGSWMSAPESFFPGF